MGMGQTERNTKWALATQKKTDARLLAGRNRLAIWYEPDQTNQRPATPNIPNSGMGETEALMGIGFHGAAALVQN